jgi:hypothetical protein
VTVSSGQLLYGNLGSLKGNTLPQKATYLAPVPTTAPWWGVNNPAMHLLKSGEKAVIRFASSQAGNWVIYCNISGQLKQP